MLTTMSWAVTAWPPVGGFGGLRANSFTICTVKTFTSSRHGHTHTQTGTHTHTHHTQRPTHCLNLLGHTHTQTETHIHTDIDTHAQRPTHYLNSLDLTLHTAHLTDNSHSDFLRDEKCFRATRRLVTAGGARDHASLALTKTLAWSVMSTRDAELTYLLRTH